MRKLSVLIMIAGLLLVSGMRLSVGAEAPVIRVSVRAGADTVVVLSRGRYQLINAETGELLASGRRLQRTTVSVAADGIHWGEVVLTTRHVQLLGLKDVSLYDAAGKEHRYRGAIDVYARTDNTVLLVNSLDLERYVRGVLYHEVSHRWPLDAMMAQAVATRTYAVYQMQQRKNELFDVTSDIYSQVYGGRSAERYRTTIAVRRTEGEVLKYTGAILPAYFHSNCGGHTEDVRELWKHDLPPLYGVVCPFCADAPNAVWKQNFRLKDIQDTLSAKGYDIGLIANIETVGRNASGRILQVRITDRDGKRIVIPGKDFRMIIGPNMLKSNNYRVEMQGYYCDIIGSGWGHGVGMCQWGAYGMATQGRSYREILLYYYPGAEIVTLP